MGTKISEISIGDVMQAYTESRYENQRELKTYRVTDIYTHFIITKDFKGNVRTFNSGDLICGSVRKI